MRAVGFTGTQHGMPDEQRATVADLLRQYRQLGADEFHHGGCIGADEQAAQIAKDLGYTTWHHQGDTPEKTTLFVSDVTLGGDPPMDNLERNHSIVHACEVLIVAPRQSQEIIRSGTWATVRYAGKVDRVIALVSPDGTCKSW